MVSAGLSVIGPAQAALPSSGLLEVRAASAAPRWVALLEGPVNVREPVRNGGPGGLWRVGCGRLVGTGLPLAPMLRGPLLAHNHHGVCSAWRAVLLPGVVRLGEGLELG